MGYGEKVVKNLSKENVLVDYGTVNINQIRMLEKNISVIFPKEYSEFIVSHNGASLVIDSFDFYDEVHKRDSRESIAFIKVKNIQETICDLLKQSTNDLEDTDIFKCYNYFDKKLIPFGDTGGGDYICFDYRLHSQDNPPIVLWCHDNCDENWNRVSFVAKSFEDFINMLY